MKLYMIVRYSGFISKHIQSTNHIFYFIPQFAGGNCVSEQATIFPYNIKMLFASKFLKVEFDENQDQLKIYQKIYRKESPKNFYRRMKFEIDRVSG